MYTMLKVTISYPTWQGGRPEEDTALHGPA